MRIGILGTSDIAFRRFLPALEKCEGFTYAGVASRTPKKGESFRERFGGAVYDGYDALLADESIGAVYVPLPPALHFQWGKKVLESGKHLLMEKPFTTSLAEAEELLALAREKGLAVHENYMFVYHWQITEIQRVISSGELGEVRLIRASFGFPYRGANDFRYDKTLGGGALLDCGGYPIRLARLLLGDTARLVDGQLTESTEFGVDLYGNATLRNDAGLTAQVAFGMDNAYQCKLEVWGSRALLTADRVFTPPADMAPKLTIQSNDGTKVIEVEPDDQFRNSIGVFERCVAECGRRSERYADIAKQSRIVDELRNGRCGA